MSNYGYGNNYSTTSYGAQGGADGGGFINRGIGSQGSQDSPSGKAYGKDTLRPVTIKQVIEAQHPHPDAEFRLDGQEITQVTFVGQVRNISTQATNITYKIDDGTGLIEVKQWVDSDAAAGSDDDAGATAALAEDKYVRVWGRIKAFNNKRHVGAQVIRPVTDPNEISMHLLEATYVHLFLTRGPPESLATGGGGGGGGGGGDDAGLFVQQQDGGGDARGGRVMPRMSDNARRVFNRLNSPPQSNEGLHVQNLAQQLGMPANDVFKAGDELLGLGAIYTTVDDETWAVLEY